MLRNGSFLAGHGVCADSRQRSERPSHDLRGAWIPRGLLLPPLCNAIASLEWLQLFFPPFIIIDQGASERLENK